MTIEFGPVWNGIERVPTWEYTDPDPKYAETVIGTWVVDVPWAMPEARQHLVAVGQALGQKDYTIFCYPIVSPILATPEWPMYPAEKEPVVSHCYRFTAAGEAMAHERALSVVRAIDQGTLNPAPSARAAWDAYFADGRRVDVSEGEPT